MVETEDEGGIKVKGTQKVTQGAAIILFFLLASCIFVASYPSGEFIQTSVHQQRLLSSGSNEDEMSSSLWSFEYDYKFHSIDNEPISVFTSTKGHIVIVGDNEGHVHRSEDYGATWKSKKPLKVGSGNEVASIYGLAMDQSGTKMVAGTAFYKNFHSHDGGATWSPSTTSDQECSIISGNSDLTNIICIGGQVGKRTHLYYGTEDNALKLARGLGRKKWMGLVSSSDMSHSVAVEKSDGNYVYISKDGGKTWGNPVQAEDKGVRGTWGCLAASSNAMSLLLTDYRTSNAHFSTNGGLTWLQLFNGPDNGIFTEKGDKITSCAISANERYYAVGFKHYYLTVAKGCTKETHDFQKGECNNHWIAQKDVFSKRRSTQTAAIAFSKTGDHIYAVDKTHLKIDSGALEE